jgi:methyl-accepting chemotaxis protein
MTGAIRMWIAGIAGLSLVLAIAIAVVVQRGLTRPLRELERAASAMSRGRLDGEIRYAAHGEVGALAASFRRSSGALAAVTGELGRLIHAARDGQLGVRGDAAKFEGAYADLVSGTNALLDSLVEPLCFVAGNAETLASASERLTQVSRQLGTNAAETSARSQLLSATAEQVSYATRSVATSTEEMAASIKEIATSASASAHVASQAVKMAESTNASKEAPRLPVIMFSTRTERGAAATIEALTSGASDYVAKPSNAGNVLIADRWPISLIEPRACLARDPLNAHANPHHR